VSDDGFDFGGPPERREARRFEPPPWEREQFERHERERAEREKREKESALAQLEALGEATQVVPAEAAIEPPAVTAPDEAAAKPAGESADKPAVDEKQLEMMMFELKASEPPVLSQVWMVQLGAGIVVALIGIVILVWGIAAFARVGSPAGPGASVLVLFGLGFAGVGGWLIFSALRQRGVL
jgi:hypothetical protein